MYKKLVTAYKVISYLHMDDHTYTHLSARSIDNIQSFYIYPFGYRFEEVTEESLMEVSLKGEIIKGNEFQYNVTGYVMHSAIYKARPDIRAIFHLHTPYITAVSSLEEGLLPISQWALHFYNNTSYHEYNSLLLNFDEIHQLVSDLGEKNVMFLRNHGVVICGKTVEEAMFFSYHLEQACKTQYIALSMGQKLVTPSQKLCEKTCKDLLTFEKNLGERDWQAWERVINKSL